MGKSAFICRFYPFRSLLRRERHLVHEFVGATLVKFPDVRAEDIYELILMLGRVAVHVGCDGSVIHELKRVIRR